MRPSAACPQFSLGHPTGHAPAPLVASLAEQSHWQAALPSEGTCTVLHDGHATPNALLLQLVAPQLHPHVPSCCRWQLVPDGQSHLLASHASGCTVQADVAVSQAQMWLESMVGTGLPSASTHAPVSEQSHWQPDLAIGTSLRHWHLPSLSAQVGYSPWHTPLEA